MSEPIRKLSDSLTSEIKDQTTVKPLIGDFYRLKNRNFVILTIVSDMVLLLIAISWTCYVLYIFQNADSQLIQIVSDRIQKSRFIFNFDNENPLILLRSIVGGSSLLFVFGVIALICTLKTDKNGEGLNNLGNKLYSIFRFKIVGDVTFVLGWNFFVDDFVDFSSLEESKNSPKYFLVILLFMVTVFPILVLAFNTSIIFFKLSFKSQPDTKHVEPAPSEDSVKLPPSGTAGKSSHIH